MLKHISTGILAGITLLLTVGATSASADYKLSIEGNGEDSENEIQFDITKDTFVSQYNNTDIVNDVNIDLDTGGNTVEGTTGGDVEVSTGDADAAVGIVNMAGFNYANLEGCGCENQDIEASIEDNGEDSENEVSVDVNDSVAVIQTNDTDIVNDVDLDLATGDNEVSGTTNGGDHDSWKDMHDWEDKDHEWKDHGQWMKHHNMWMHKDHHENDHMSNNGDVKVETGDVNADVAIVNKAGLNVATFNSCDCEVGDVDVEIKDNGEESKNELDLSFDKSFFLWQENDTDIVNNVHVMSSTGDNEVEGSTGDFHHGMMPWWAMHAKAKDVDHDWDDKKFWWMKHHDWDNDKDHDWWKNHHDRMSHLNSGDMSLATGNVETDVSILNVASANFFML